MKYILSLLVFLVLHILPGNAQNPAATIPEFSFEKQDKSNFSRKDITAGRLSFFVFFDTSCDHCQQALEYLNTHQSQFAKAKIYLVTMDARERVAAFLEKHGNKLSKAKNTILLFDTKNHFITRFTPRKYPSLMLYSKEGKLLLYDDEEKNLPQFIEKIKG